MFMIIRLRMKFALRGIIFLARNYAGLENDLDVILLNLF